jgi:putative oxidoreductase
MNKLLSAKRWAETHRDVGLDLLRIYLGIGLVVKGIAFVAHGATLMEAMTRAEITWGGGLATYYVAVAHAVVMAHVVGGFLLAVGLVTRGAALVNIPVLFGATFFVHAKDGFFTEAQTLEFALLVLVMLVVIAVHGGGRLSLDHYVAAHADREDRTDPDLESSRITAHP